MRVRAARLPLLVSIAFVALGGGSAAALGGRSDQKAIWGPVTLSGKSEFPVYHRSASGIFEMDLNWADIAPTPPRNPTDPSDPAYLWPRTSLRDREATRYHMRVMLQAIETPAWANGGRAWNYPPTRSRSPDSPPRRVATRRFTCG